MGDAEIIPIGTRGRPGRGSGSMHPSSAARGLAGSRTPSAPAPEAEPDAEPVAVAEAQAGAEAGQSTGEAAGEVREPATTEERGAIPGIPVEEWWAAIRTAAESLAGSGAGGGGVSATPIASAAEHMSQNMDSMVMATRNMSESVRAVAAERPRSSTG